MKFAIAYYLLLIYSTVIVKPLIPVAEDALMHCFAEAHHVATVHATEGKNHIEKEIAANADSDSNNKNQKADKVEQPIHETAIEFVYSFITTHSLRQHFIFFTQLPGNIYIDFINPPPRA